MRWRRCCLALDASLLCRPGQVRRWWARQTLLVPWWLTLLTIANLSMFLIQSLDHRNAFSHPLVTVAITGSLVALCVALYLALVGGKQPLVPVRQRLLTVILSSLLAANTLLHVFQVLPHLAQAQRYSTDAAAATDCAAQLVVRGHDPYSNIHMLTCLYSHGLGPAQTTPKRVGTFWVFATYPSPDTAHFQYLLYRVYSRELRREQHNPQYISPEFETRFNYPGGALLLAVLTLFVGFRDLVPLSLGCALAASVLIYRRAEAHIRWAVGLVLLGDTPLLLNGVGGATDSWYALFLVLAWHYRARPLSAGLLLGVAAAVRQQAWFFVPFLLFAGWRTQGLADLLRRSGSALAVFLACNLPFIVASPGDWLAGVLGPMRDPLFAQGVGLVALSFARVLPLWPPVVYGGLELLFLAATFLLFTRQCMTSPGLAMLLPLLPLVLAWRSLHSYFLLLPLLAVAVLAYPDDHPATGAHSLATAPIRRARARPSQRAASGQA